MPLGKIAWVFIATTIAVFFGIVVAQISLPMLTTGLGTQLLESFVGLSASDLISWFVYLVTYGMATIILFILASGHNPLAGYRRAITISLLASLLVIPEICVISWAWILTTHPDVLLATSLTTKGLNILSFPSLVIALVGDPQVVWLLSDLLFAIHFLVIFLLKTRAP